MSDRDPRGPRHGRHGGPDRPPQPPQPPYGGQPYGQDPYGTGPRGQDPYGGPPAYGGGHQAPPPGGPPPGRPPHGAPPPPQGPPQQPRHPAPPPPQGGQAPQPGPGRQPYAGPPAYPQRPGPPPGGPQPAAGQPPAGRPPEYLPPFYRREEGVAGPGFALPDQYKTPVAERPKTRRKQLFRLRGPVRVIVSVVVLVVGTGVAVGLPYRDQLNAYDKQKKATLSYTTVAKGKIGSIAGTRFGLGKFTVGDSTLEFQAPAGTRGVKALLLYRSLDKKAELRMSYLEYAFRDAQGRTWTAEELPDFGKSRVKRVEIKALVPKNVAGQVRPVVRPKQTLEEFDDPTQVPRDPALVFQH